ncbi:MAG: acetyl-CoA carboxylase biotin carboxylase subunit [Planctomycetes bacterium]|nr:acetyl-CoA carboxylase biotin carboxylase subunit [Planctomycetota bacterium]
MARRIDTVLIANRGEIAVRVIRACRETGRRAVVVYSEADADGLAVQLADEAICIGPPAGSKSYLRVEKVVAAAKACGAQAIHPGYGFLSERHEAAHAVEEAGLIWLGPRAETIAVVGDKIQARAIAREAGVPVIPGSDGAIDPSQALALAEQIGYPLLLKAQGGGGGKGIRVVDDPQSLLTDLERASGEAESAFGNAGVYLERCVRPARHIEVQILGDGQGNAIHLGERECSLQRRQQKVLEESPSPFVGPELRERLGKAAVALAQAVRYRSAGTVEFLVDEAGEFYFLEVNARLQVEHPVTEWVTGLDLVRAQLHVAEHDALPFTQEAWQPRGHAIELRVNAEDPARGFAPSIGTIRGLRLPAGPFVRVDTALIEGSEVTPYYDSLLAKLTVWGNTRAQAVERLAAASAAFRIGGVTTTLALIPALVADPEFLTGAFHTAWLEPWVKRQSATALSPEELEAAAVAAALSAHTRQAAPAAAPSTAGGLSPWVLAGRRGRG